MSQSFLPEVKVVKDEEPTMAKPPNGEPFVADSETKKDDSETKKEEEVEEEQEVIQEVLNEVKEEPPTPIENIFEEPVKLTKAGKPRKKRRPLTDEEKARLAKAREKATEARRRKAAEKREALELEKKEKELLKKQRKKKLDDLERSLEDKSQKVEKVLDGVKEKVETPIAKEPQPVKDKPVIVDDKNTPTQGLFSQKQLDEAVMNGIIGYEKIRKERKAKKREEQAKAQEQQKLKQTLQRAINPKPFNPYDGICY